MVAGDMLILHALLVIILIPYEISSLEVVRTDLNGITWGHARDACKPYGLENREDNLRSSGICDEKEFWIGKAIYRVPTRWFEIIGCFHIPEILMHSFHSEASIGYCKHKCDSENMGSYFGYRQRVPNTKTQNCLCHPNVINQKQQLDIKYCLNSTNFFLYREYQDTVRKSSDPGNCTTICCGYCDTNTGNDNHLEGRRCSSVNTTIVGRCGTRPNASFTWELDYFGSLDFCMRKNELLPSSNYCQQSGSKGQISWTTVFREEIRVIRIKDFEEEPELCFSGVFTSVEGQNKLNMRVQDCSNKIKWYICESTSLVSTQTVLRNGQREKGNNSTLTGAVIGGILGTCSLLTVSALLIVCKIRSKGIFKKSNKYEKGETSKLHFSKTTNQGSSNTADRKSTSLTSRKKNDHCEMGTSKYSVVNNLDIPENMNETYTDVADGEYDILHDKQNRRICPQDNMYYSHGANRKEDGLTYDSAAFGKGNCNDGNALYDTSCSVVKGEYSYMSYKIHDINITTDIYDKST
ncbi:uncharacterized protein LOC127723489 [Mytilus californianus]|uniref:uncharacterized protein LOC127723489 n=1 Tax=Mytilus californianus TaxID=6549 RepID=UPI0022462C30|nr:uncharacterized protein LOC127723489 [Mytilus californianus]